MQGEAEKFYGNVLVKRRENKYGGDNMAENQNIEWKESWRDEYLKWICGFANAQGGKVYIGTADDGTVIGITDSKKLLEDIPNKVRDILGIFVVQNRV